MCLFLLSKPTPWVIERTEYVVRVHIVALFRVLMMCVFHVNLEPRYFTSWAVFSPFPDIYRLFKVPRVSFFRLIGSYRRCKHFRTLSITSIITKGRLASELRNFSNRSSIMFERLLVGLQGYSKYPCITAVSMILSNYLILPIL